MIQADMHVHTVHCGHATGSARAMVDAAIWKGITILGFSEHFPYPPDVPDLAGDSIASAESFEAYALEIQKLQSDFKGQLDIRFGAEVDFHPDHVEWTNEQVNRYPFDFIIGSVHLIDNIPIDYSREFLDPLIEKYRGEAGLWKTYWQAVEQLLDQPWINAVGHLDLPKKFLHLGSSAIDSATLQHLFRKMKKRNVAIDVNTAGIVKATDHQLYPSPFILQIAVESNVDLMIGSDAHAPNEVGRAFESTRELLLSLGFKKSVTFQKRQKIIHPF